MGISRLVAHRVGSHVHIFFICRSALASFFSSKLRVIVTASFWDDYIWRAKVALIYCMLLHSAALNSQLKPTSTHLMSTAAQQHCITLHKERSICHTVDIYLLAPLSWNAGLRSFSSSLYSVHCLEVLCWVKASWQLVSSLRRFSIIWGQVAKCDFGVVEFIIVSVISAEWHPVLNLLAGNDEAWCYTLSINPFCIHVNALHESWLTEMLRCISAPLGYECPRSYLLCNGVILSAELQAGLPRTTCISQWRPDMSFLIPPHAGLHISERVSVTPIHFYTILTDVLCWCPGQKSANVLHFEIRGISTAMVQLTKTKHYMFLELERTTACKCIMDCFIYHSKHNKKQNKTKKHVGGL